jgi:Dolichyl-phosphate-mannose-protein mannosyltransferase/Tetratricopeptide repeat
MSALSAPLDAARSNRGFLGSKGVFGVLALVFVIRMLQLVSALNSPLTYQPGPDEDYYRRFGLAVAAGQGAADSPEFTFMDPAYGYLLGGLFKLFGPNLFVIFLLQILLDTLTAYGIIRVGRILERPRAGLIGAAVYGLTATAVMFCTTLLKEVWVTAYLTWWIVGALTVTRSRRLLHWLLFGLYCGLGVGFRSTLLTLTVAGALLPWLMQIQSARLHCAALVVLGSLVALLPWSIRNHNAYGSFSPLPHNGGIVLQQVYNDQNPRAEIWIPPFVSYLHPSEIWNGYAAEANRRLGYSVSPAQVDAYWHDEAIAYIEQHPGTVMTDILRKSCGMLSNNELANNRSDTEERMFSTVLAVLPAPAAWLLGMGLAGLVWLGRESRRWLIVAVPIALAWLTMAVFFAESRFRFHAASMLALASGIWIDRLVQQIRARENKPLVVFVPLAAVIVAISLILGSRTPQPPIAWERIAWGYINMGQIREAQALAVRIASKQPDNGAILEALGYIDAVQKQYTEAAQVLQRAVELRPRSHLAHFNLARVYMLLGDRERAQAEATTAEELHPSPDYQALLSQIQSGT